MRDALGAGLQAGVADDDMLGDWPRRPRSLPEQIADDVARRILAGTLAAGRRIGEEDLAQHYGVSRGPVRDAFQVLQRQGLVQVLPRRGTFVALIDNDFLCDLFNIRAALVALSAAYCAMLATETGREEIADRVVALERLTEDPDCDPRRFALGNGRIGAALGRNCGSFALKASLVEGNNGIVWAIIFREHIVDYVTPMRRDRVVAQWRAVLDCIFSQDPESAESGAREILLENRDEVLSRLSIPGASPPDRRRLLQRRPSPSAACAESLGASIP
jgi:DNA-binding GntR family transcriptional regulator